MSKKSGTIDLSSVRIITGVVPLSGFVSVEMLSSDLSASTTLSAQLSVGGTNYDIARESGTDITDTLVNAATLYVSFRGVPGDYWKVVFDGATTGNVAYNANSL